MAEASAVTTASQYDTVSAKLGKDLANLSAKVATLDKAKADLVKATTEYDTALATASETRDQLNVILQSQINTGGKIIRN